MRSLYWVGAVLASSLLIGGCGRSGGGGGSSKYTIGGTISGLTASGLTLSTNGQSVSPASGATNFTFSTAFPSGIQYYVSVSAQPTGETCAVADSSGTLASANVTNVQVTCTANTVSSTYTVGGTISGLTASGLTLKETVSGQTLSPASGATSFTFPTAVASGASYSVTVSAQPAGETCVVANGSGTVPSANVTNVQVTCTANTVSSTYTVGGTISGLTASGLTLKEAVSGQTLSPASGATSFTFPTAVASGASYSVTVSAQPTGETCAVANGSGTVGSSNITSVQVTCTANTVGQLTITTPSLSAATVGTAYSQTINVSGGVAPYTFSISSGSLPSWASSSTFDSSGKITGTPSSSDAGTVSFTVEVTDSASNKTTQAYDLTTFAISGANNALLNGTYAFLVKGWIDGIDNGSTSEMAAVGSLTADGNGNIVSGTADLTSIYGSYTVTVTGTYALPSNNLGQMTLQLLGGPKSPQTITLAFSAGSIQSSVATAGSIIEFDDTTGIGSTPGGQRFTGEFSMQTPSDFAAANLTGGYIFGLEGETCPVYLFPGGPTPNTNCSATPTEGPLAIAGTMDFSGSGTISSGMEDIGLNDGNCPTSGGSATCTSNYQQDTFSGSYGTPNSVTGRTTLTLGTPSVLPSGTQAIWPTNYVAYIVNSSKIYIISADSHLSDVLLAGKALQNTVASFTNANLNGNVMIYDTEASDNPGWGNSTYTPTSSTNLGLINFTGSSGTLSGTLQQNQEGTQTSQTVSGAFSVASNGRLTLTAGQQPPVFYLSGSGSGFGIEESGAVGLFTMEPQTATTPGNATYVGEYMVPVANSGAETMLVTLNSGSATILESASTSSGTLTWDASKAGSYTLDSTGLFTESSSGSSNPALGYVISANKLVIADRAQSTNTSPGITVIGQ